MINLELLTFELMAGESSERTHIKDVDRYLKDYL
jgi:hypothetical protein